MTKGEIVYIAKDLHKGFLAMTSAKGERDVAVVRLLKGYKAGESFDMEDVEEVQAVLRFADRESLDLFVCMLSRILREWKNEKAEEPD